MVVKRLLRELEVKEARLEVKGVLAIRWDCNHWMSCFCEGFATSPILYQSDNFSDMPLLVVDGAG